MNGDRKIDPVVVQTINMFWNKNNKTEQIDQKEAQEMYINIMEGLDVDDNELQPQDYLDYFAKLDKDNTGFLNK